MQSVFCSILLYPILFRNTLPSNAPDKSMDYFAATATPYKESVYIDGHTNGSTSSLGAHYTFNLAHAGTAPGTVVAGTNLQYNICPKNWTIAHTGIYQSLISSYTNATNLKNAFYPISGGHYWDNTISGGWSYWSSTTSSHPNFGDAKTACTIWEGTVNCTFGRGDGVQVRCLAK